MTDAEKLRDIAHTRLVGKTIPEVVDIQSDLLRIADLLEAVPVGNKEKTMDNIANELRIRAKGGHEGIKELELWCSKAADEIDRFHASVSRLLVALKTIAAQQTVGRIDEIASAAIVREEKEQSKCPKN